MVKAIILGVHSTSLSEEERKILQDINPLGFILFSRNIKSEDQLIQLIADLRTISDRKNLPIFIDQEGGRVQRIKTDLNVPLYPAAKIFGDIAQTGLNSASKLCRSNYYLLGLDLQKLGINVNCAPCIDLFHDTGHSVIGDRSFGPEAKIVCELGKAAIYGLKEAGIMPIIKHIPGHGLSKVDSHKNLPVIYTPLDQLEMDFLPFKELANHAEIAMTAHIIYTAIDPEKPVTLSKKAITYIREVIGFKNVLISDDIGMKALSGSMKDIALEAFQAGCDIILHCSGNIEEIKQFTNIELPVNDLVQKIFLTIGNPFIKVEEQTTTLFDKELLLTELKQKTGYAYTV